MTELTNLEKLQNELKKAQAERAEYERKEAQSREFMWQLFEEGRISFDELKILFVW